MPPFPGAVSRAARPAGGRGFTNLAKTLAMGRRSFSRCFVYFISDFYTKRRLNDSSMNDSIVHGYRTSRAATGLVRFRAAQCAGVQPLGTGGGEVICTPTCTLISLHAILYRKYAGLCENGFTAHGCQPWASGASSAAWPAGPTACHIDTAAVNSGSLDLSSRGRVRH
jgi:hypothetical protein